MAQISTL